MPTTKEAIERFKWLENQHVAVAIWREDDVLELAMEEGIRCSRKRAREIIDEIDHKQDAMMSISWGTIRVYLKEYGWGGQEIRTMKSIITQIKVSTNCVNFTHC